MKHFKKFLASALVLALVLALMPIPADAGAVLSPDEQLAQLRRELAPTAPPPALPQVFVEGDFIHIPPIEPPVLTPLFTEFAPFTVRTPYKEGDSREFFSAMSMDVFTGHLVWQTDLVNIWIDDLNAAATMNRDEIVAKFDTIIENVTRDFGAFEGVVVHTPFHYQFPVVGDIHGDGRVNVLLYDMGDPDLGGYFSFASFAPTVAGIPDGQPHEPIAMFTGNLQSYQAGDYDFFFNTFAHEFQHLLFFMHFGVYTMVPFGVMGYYAPTATELLWFNEGMSELAGRYWADRGTIVNINRTLAAIPNSYYYDDPRIGDFISFNNSSKNYGMSMFFTSFAHRNLGDDPAAHNYFPRAVYEFFAENFPPAQNLDEYMANINRLSGMTMTEVVGDILAGAGLAGSTGAVGEQAFANLFFCSWRILRRTAAAFSMGKEQPQQESLSTAHTASIIFGACAGFSERTIYSSITRTMPEHRVWTSTLTASR